MRFGVVAAVVAGLCAAVPVAADDAWHQRSEVLSIDAHLAPRHAGVAVGAFQDWVLTLKTADGEPVEQVGIAVGGGMPGHGHGLPSQPAVTEYLGGGRYLVQGVKLNMRGRWIIAFGLQMPHARDRVSFELDIGASDGESLRTLLSSLYLDPDIQPPPSPSNRVADDPVAAQLGRKLFFDKRLSADGKLSCASCHDPDRYFTDGRDRAVGVARTGRNTPTIVGTGHQSWFYWDGRRDSLWAQALVPFEAADEMGGSRVAVVRQVGADADYRALYEEVFGDFPSDLLQTALPEQAGPLGDKALRDAWQGIDTGTAKRINTVYANLGKAIEAFERSLPTPTSRFDRYAAAVIAGDADADLLLTDDEHAGLELFLDAGRTHCLRCHNGPWLTNGGFHNIGTGSFSGPDLDFGRVFGLRSVVMDEFNCLGPYSDAAAEDCTELRFLNRNSHVPLEGAFKTPGLRNLAATAPYMHDGRFETLEAVIEFYRNPPAPEQSGAHELPSLDISDTEAAQLIAFLRSLSAAEKTR